MSLPELISAYNEYLSYIDTYDSKNNIIDLSNAKFFYPTTLLPLIIFIQNKKCGYKEPKDPYVSFYIKRIIDSRDTINTTSQGSYIPPIQLPVKEEYFDPEGIIDNISNYLREWVSRIHNILFYIISELSNNIYQHASCSLAYIMAQRYDRRRFVELSIIDNGITIRGSLSKKIRVDSDSEAIISALKGYSSKEEKGRGYGLSTSIRNLTEVLNGEVLIVSGTGLLYLHKRRGFRCDNNNLNRRLDGTLISTRVSLHVNSNNIELSQIYEKHINLSNYNICNI